MATDDDASLYLPASELSAIRSTTLGTEIVPVDRSAEVYATVQHRGREVRVRAVLLGKPIRLLGEAVAAEVEVTDGGEEVPAGRVTLVPIKHVNAANDAASVRLGLAPPRT